MISINTNLSSLIIQTNLKQSTFGLNQAIERMTTGFKINGAKDNAANYSISTQMSTKLSAYQVAEDNASMGLDLLTTAGDSLSLINEHLTRIRDLTTQAKNGTYGDESMKAINSEINARLDEIQRLYDTTEFNGLKLFGEEVEAGTKPAFIQEVVKRDTSAMTTLASVDENTYITSGTYSISTAEELAKLATMTNNAKIYEYVEFVLANDIDLSAYSNGEGWTPIGINENQLFHAIFDGNGYEIKNLYINRPTEDYQGLFGYTSSVSTIKNVALANVDVTGDAEIGALVGKSSGTISNCYSTGSVNGASCAGGLVGWQDQKMITECYSSATVTGGERVAGLVGYLYGSGVTIQNSYSSGSVTGNKYVGGFLGYMRSTSPRYSTTFISNCYSTGSVTGIYNAGGLVGFFNNGTITDSYYNKETSGQSDTGRGEGITSAEIREKMIAAGLIKDGTADAGIVSNLIVFQIGIHSNAESQLNLSTAFALTNLSDLRNIGLSDGNYLETIDNLLASISAKQTEYGACQNRLESALEEINTHYENLLSSRSTLRDADVAQESSAYIRNQILQQASATLLATANQTPAIALQLL